MEILDMHRLPSAICGSFAEIPGVMVIKTAQNMPEILRVRSRLMDRLDCCGQDFRIQFIRLNSISFLEIQIELENVLCPYGSYADASGPQTVVGDEFHPTLKHFLADWAFLGENAAKFWLDSRDFWGYLNTLSLSGSVETIDCCGECSVSCNRSIQTEFELKNTLWARKSPDLKRNYSLWARIYLILLYSRPWFGRRQLIDFHSETTSQTTIELFLAIANLLKETVEVLPVQPGMPNSLETKSKTAYPSEPYRRIWVGM